MAAEESNQRASQVCNICKARKKACDKILPTCSYCSKRGLECRYDRSADTARAEAVSVGNLADLLSCNTGPTLDGILNLQVCHVIYRTRISLEQLTERFFRYFHQWLPIISPATFRETATRHQHGVPPADFSILLLSMYLIVLRPTNDFQSNEIQPRDLYYTAKLFFSYVQAKLCASISLVQSGVLIASYEYACGKPEGAYVSLGTALRMGHVLELQYTITTNSLYQGPHLEPTRAERRNLWWGIIVMERLIVLELPSKHLSLSTRYPKTEFEYPSGLDGGNTPSSNGASSTHNHFAKDDFANVVRACYFLDAVLTENESPEVERDLDKQTLEFLRDAMKSSEHAPHSDTLAVATRALMLHHQTVLERISTDQHQKRKSTEDALDTAATMILEAAHDHSEHLNDVDALSLSCYYCLNVALRQYEKRASLQQQNHITTAAASARALMRVFRERWPSP